MANNFVMDRTKGHVTTHDAIAHTGLTALAAFINARTLRKHALFFLATIAVVLIYGYSFGTFDHAVHIPGLKAFADPSLYPGDWYLNLRFQHYSYFWRLFEPF